MKMLDLTMDLSDLCMALEDNSSEHQWWLDPNSGELELRVLDYSADGEANDPEERGFIYVDPIDSHEAYGDMEDFSLGVADPRARDLLERAIAGRGAFRRFKDTLLDFPELREAWFRFHDVRMERRAIAWLEREGAVAAEDAERAIAQRPDPAAPVPAQIFDARAVATAVAGDLRSLYGDRLQEVILFGSWARGDAHPESDVDLLVVLDEVSSRWVELARMSEILWRHSLEHDTVLTEIPVSGAEYAKSDEPLLARARAEGVRVT
jgi:predicted nucleotidyltransferase